MMGPDRSGRPGSRRTAARTAPRRSPTTRRRCTGSAASTRPPSLPPPTSPLPLQYPPLVSQVPQWSPSQEAALVEQVTARGMFAEHLSTAQDGSNLIVLDPLPPQ